jgi:DNA-directed RNA polymerase subunit E'/Rpb7
MNDNINTTLNNTAIVVTDAQIATKSNRYANEGFYFCAMGSAYPSVKFDTILFTCPLATEILQKWANNFIKLGLKEDGNFIGLTLPIEDIPDETPIEELPTEQTEAEAILAETQIKQVEEIDEALTETKDEYVKTKKKKKSKIYGKDE